MTQTAEPSHTNIAGTRISWHETGPATGPVLLLVHGFPFHSGMWQPQLSAPPAGWRVIAPDLRGFGASAAGTEALSMDRFADDLAALLDHLQVQRAVVCGLSMGGYVTFSLLRRRPGLVAALVLCDTRAGADTPAARAGREQAATQVVQSGTAQFIDDMMPKLLSPFTRRRKPEVEVELRAIMEAAQPAVVAATLRAIAERPDSTPVLQNIAVPTQVIVGVDDSITPPLEARFMARTIRGAHIMELDDAAHVPNLEQADIFNRVLTSFLQSLA